MKRAITIGAVVAVVLSFIRGGIADAPTVLVVFGLTGFYASLFLSWLFRIETIHTIEIALGRLPHSFLLRNVISSATALSLLFWSGPFVRSGGLAGWLLAIVLCIIAPLIVCMVAPRLPIAYGAFTVTCIASSLLIENARWNLAHGNTEFWSDFWPYGVARWIIAWLIAIALSFLASVPIKWQRRIAQEAFPRPSETAERPVVRLSLLRFTVKAVAMVIVPAVMLFGAMRLDKRLERLRSEYLEKSNYHNAAVSELVEAQHKERITTLSELTRLEKVYAATDPRISWHRKMSEKYSRAYFYPLWPVRPDARPPDAQ